MQSAVSYVSLPIRLELGSKGLKFGRAQIKFAGIEQAGSSFEGRVFLNNPGADLHTAPTAENGYAGSFHVFGYGVWPQDVGKDPNERAEKTSVARAPIEKSVIATEAVRAAAARGPEVTITVVPLYPGSPPRSAYDALTISEIEILIE